MTVAVAARRPRTSRTAIRYARLSLRVPPGHPRAGKPLRLPPFLLDFLADALTHPESLLCIARKNAKSAAVAVLCLAHLDPLGPFTTAGWTAGVLSVNREKAGLLLGQVARLIEYASGPMPITIRRQPYPGCVVSASGQLEVQSADRGAGQASGFDLAIVDELGLLQERDRELVAGMRSSTGAKGGRFVALSVHGSGPFIPEMLERKASPDLAVHHYAGDPDLEMDDPANWAAANPGIAAGIKSADHMRSEAARVRATPADANHYRAYELNLPVDPSTAPVVPLSSWRVCEVEHPPPRGGLCAVGIDLGGSVSMTAAAALWQSGRLELWAAVGDVPKLADRAAADQAGGAYQLALDRGELWTFPGRVVDVGTFLRALVANLSGAEVVAVGADGYRRAEAEQAFDDAAVPWERVWRGGGRSGGADHAHDVRRFQDRVLTARLAVQPHTLMRRALAGAVCRLDDGLNPKLDKGRSTARIDLVSAACIAAGLVSMLPTQSVIDEAHVVE